MVFVTCAPGINSDGSKPLGLCRKVKGVFVEVFFGGRWFVLVHGMASFFFLWGGGVDFSRIFP